MSYFFLTRYIAKSYRFTQAIVNTPKKDISIYQITGYYNGICITFLNINCTLKKVTNLPIYRVTGLPRRSWIPLIRIPIYQVIGYYFGIWVTFLNLNTLGVFTSTGVTGYTGIRVTFCNAFKWIKVTLLPCYRVTPVLVNTPKIWIHAG